MYWVTLTPKSLAGTRCPISCRPIDTARPITMMTTPRMKASTESTPLSVLPPPWRPLSFGCENGCRGRPARVGPRRARVTLRAPRLGQRAMRAMRAVCGRRACGLRLGERGDRERRRRSPRATSTTARTVSTMSRKPIRPGVEGRDRLLVRGVEHRGVLAAGPAHLLGERHGRERRRRRAARTSSSSRWSSRAAGRRRRRGRASRGRARSAAACRAARPGRSWSRR